MYLGGGTPPAPRPISLAGPQHGSQLLDSAQRRSLVAPLFQASSVPIKNFNFKRIGEDVCEKLDYTARRVHR